MDDPRSLPVPAAWREPIADWTLAMRAAGARPETIKTRTDHLRRAARALRGTPADVTGADLVGWCGAQTWSRETRRSVHASLRSFWRWAVGVDLVDVDAAAQLPRVRAAEPVPRPAPAQLVDAAIVDADERTALVLRCAVDVGMRRAEVAVIHQDDLVRDLVGWSIIVHGKGGRTRTLPLPDDLAVDLREACEAGAGWAFPGRIGGHLSPRRVGELATDALPGAWTMHTLRHSFGTRVHAATHDLLAVQQLLGHASVATTQRYVATDGSRLRQAVLAGARDAA